MIRRPNPLRLHWDAEAGWRVDAPCALAPVELQRLIDWAIPRQVDRLTGLPPGSKRDELAAAISALRAGQIRVCVVGRGETKMFEAPVPSEDRKIIMVGNGD